MVRDAAVHEDVLQAAAAAAHDNGLVVRGLTFSPIKGPEGNIEFWMWAAFDGEPTDATPESVVAQAHTVLGGS